MNATFDLKESLKLLRLLKTGRGPGTQWLRVTAIEEFLIFEAGQGVVWVPALVLEPGAFSTRRTPFNQVLSSFTGSKTLTLQADAGRFRINSFSGQILDYDPSPVRPKGFEPCADEENSEPPGAKPANVVPIVLDNKRVQATAPQTPTLPMQPAPSEIEIIQPKDKTEGVSSAGNPMTREVDPSGAPQKQATSEPEVEKNDQGGDRYFGGYGQYAQTFTNPTSAEIYHTYYQKLTGDTRPRPSSNAPAPKPAEPSLARAYKWTGANMVGSVRRNVAATLVIAYAVFVLGSLFCAPWEGWENPNDRKWGYPRITQYGPIFSPPVGLRVAPRLKSEEIVLVWGALGVATFAGVYLSKGKKNGVETVQ